MEEVFFSIPPVTRYYLILNVSVTLLVTYDFLNAFQLMLFWDHVFLLSQYYRLIGTFLFSSYFGLSYILHSFFMVRYSIELEESVFRNKRAQYIGCWAFGAATLLVFHYVLFLSNLYTRMVFLNPSLVFYIVYIWSKTNPDVAMSFLGLFVFYAPSLPWVMMLFSALMSGTDALMFDLLGILAGHCYYFLKFVYPQVTGRVIF